MCSYIYIKFTQRPTEGEKGKKEKKTNSRRRADRTFGVFFSAPLPNIPCNIFTVPSSLANLPRLRSRSTRRWEQPHLPNPRWSSALMTFQEDWNCLITWGLPETLKVSSTISAPDGSQERGEPRNDPKESKWGRGEWLKNRWFLSVDIGNSINRLGLPCDVFPNYKGGSSST